MLYIKFELIHQKLDSQQRYYSFKLLIEYKHLNLNFVEQTATITVTYAIFARFLYLPIHEVYKN